MAESHHDELEKLEALYAQHPEGRVFMHLAEAYRKAGELERARELLDEGMERYPDYASAHVVLGRILLDLDESARAQSAFHRVLELDPQNLVALRALGELAEREERIADALDYFRQLQALEPTDEALEDRIADLEAAGPPDGRTAADPDGAGTAPPVSSDPDPIDAELPGAVEPTGPEPEPDTEDPGGEPDTTVTPIAGFEPTREFAPPQESEEASDEAPAEASAEAADEEDALELPDLSGGEDPSDEAVGPDGPAAADSPEPVEPLEPLGPLDPMDPMDPMDTAEPAEASGTGAAPAERSEFAPPEEEPASGAGSGAGDDLLELTDVVEEPAGAAGADAPGRDGQRPVVTETMADIYARQGLYDRAAEVYRRLLEQRPDDARLEARLAEMETNARDAEGTPDDVAADQAGTSGIPDDAWLIGDDDYPDEDDVAAAASASGEPPSTESGPADVGSVDAESIEAAWTAGAGVAGAEVTPYAWAGDDAESPAVEPSGVTVGEYFRELLAWRPSRSTPESAPDAAAPAKEPSGRANEPSGPASRPESSGTTGSPSTDEFDRLFEGDAASESPAPGGDAPADESGGETADEDDDLEAFREWLQNLKR